MIIFFVIIAFTDKWLFFTAIAFAIGAITSTVSGYIGMKVATKCNVRVAFLAATYSDPEQALSSAFSIAFRGGCVMGFILVSLALGVLTIMLGVFIRIIFFKIRYITTT